MKDFDDESLFAWNPSTDQEYRGLLAKSPAEFGNSSYSGPLYIQGDLQLTCSGVSINGVFELGNAGSGPSDIVLRLSTATEVRDGSQDMEIVLRRWGRRYLRVTSPSMVLKKPGTPGAQFRTVAQKITCVRNISQLKSAEVAQELASEAPKVDTAQETGYILKPGRVAGDGCGNCR